MAYFLRLFASANLVPIKFMVSKLTSQSFRVNLLDTLNCVLPLLHSLILDALNFILFFIVFFKKSFQMYCLSRPPKDLYHKILNWWLVLVTKACNNWPLPLEILLAKSQQQDVCKICRIDVICSANCQNWYGIGLQRNTHVDILRQSSLFFSSIHQFFDQSHHKNIKDRHNNDNRQPSHHSINKYS